jgi:hypothetical protein
MLGYEAMDIEGQLVPQDSLSSESLADMTEGTH